jgi:hypothetical protein
MAPHPHTRLAGPLLAFAVLALAACEPPPIDTGRAPRPTGPAPIIRPLDEVLAETAMPTLEPTDTAALQARAAGLQQRAGAISASESDPETRARLDAALDAKAE